jgi:hypothetical protein
MRKSNGKPFEAMTEDIVKGYQLSRVFIKLEIMQNNLKIQHKLAKFIV